MNISNFLASHAVNELLSLGYTVENGDLRPPANSPEWDALVAARFGQLPMTCGHPASMTLKSAETGKPLFCEACDDKTGRRDAETMEEVLRADKRGLLEALYAARMAIESMKQSAETAGAGGDEQMLQEACEEVSQEGLAASDAIRAAVQKWGRP